MIVVNTSFRLAPWADVLYAMDRDWWKAYLPEVRTAFAGALVSQCSSLHGVQLARSERKGNSGAGALALALHHGARLVTLLGYDGGHVGGVRAHWHADHPAGLGNAGSSTAKKWPAQFRAIAAALKGVVVINASRQTLIDAFPRVPLTEALERQ